MYDRGHVKEKQRDSQKFLVYCRLILSSQKYILLRSCNGHINLIIINTITFFTFNRRAAGLSDKYYKEVERKVRVLPALLN